MACLSSIQLSRALYSFAQTCVEYKLLSNYTPLHQQQLTGMSHGSNIQSALGVHWDETGVVVMGSRDHTARHGALG